MTSTSTPSRPDTIPTATRAGHSAVVGLVQGPRRGSHTNRPDTAASTGRFVLLRPAGIRL